MGSRFGLLFVVTSALVLTFLLACLSTGTVHWISLEQTGKDPNIIFLKADRGLFRRCILTKFRSREITQQCFSLTSGYDANLQQGYEKACAGLMLTATVLMGIASIFSFILMVSKAERSGVFGDVVPIYIGLVAGVLAIIGLGVYNTQYEPMRRRLIGTGVTPYTENDINFGYSFYVGWLSALIHFLIIFFYYICRAWIDKTDKERFKKAQQFKLLQQKPV
eukprot:gene15267-16842_t